MYERHFGLSQSPFSIAPDPRYLFMSERHREALAHLLYGVKAGGGFVLLTGEIGAGKTTICRSLLAQIPEHCDVAYIFNPKLTVEELLGSICAEFRIPARHEGPGVATVKDYVDALNDYLLRTHASGRSSVLIIDEAQALSADVLEQLRLLTNLETDERKLLQIVLIGQPELRDMLARPDMEQLAQRVIARYHLDALGPQETEMYIRHRMAIAGLAGPLPFDERALRGIYRYTRGVPRRINLLCDRALLGAYARGKSRVDVRTVEEAVEEVLRPASARKSARSGSARKTMVGLGLAAVLALIAAVVFLVVPRNRDGAPANAAATGNSLQSAAGTGVAVGSPDDAKAAGMPPGASAAPPSPTQSSPAPSSPAPPSAVASEAAPASTPGEGASSATNQSPPTATPRPAALPVASASVAAGAPPFDLPTGFASLVGAERSSWQALARRWGIAVADDDPCRSAQEQRIHCFRSTKATLALIRQLNRPGILTLRDADNRAAYAVLLGLGPSSATLSVDGAPRSVPLVSLADYWRGEFATLWRAPAGFSAVHGAIVPGPAERWLVRQLAIARGEPPPTKARVDAATLDDWIHAFQLAQGLHADGIAGPMTLMMLNQAVGIDEPRLETER